MQSFGEEFSYQLKDGALVTREGQKTSPAVFMSDKYFEGSPTATKYLKVLLSMLYQNKKLTSFVSDLNLSVRAINTVYDNSKTFEYSDFVNDPEVAHSKTFVEYSRLKKKIFVPPSDYGKSVAKSLGYDEFYMLFNPKDPFNPRYIIGEEEYTMEDMMLRLNEACDSHRSELSTISISTMYRSFFEHCTYDASPVYGQQFKPRNVMIGGISVDMVKKAVDEGKFVNNASQLAKAAAQTLNRTGDFVAVMVDTPKGPKIYERSMAGLEKYGADIGKFIGDDSPLVFYAKKYNAYYKKKWTDEDYKEYFVKKCGVGKNVDVIHQEKNSFLVNASWFDNKEFSATLNAEIIHNYYLVYLGNYVPSWMLVYYKAPTPTVRPVLWVSAAKARILQMRKYYVLLKAQDPPKIDTNYNEFVNSLFGPSGNYLKFLSIMNYRLWEMPMKLKMSSSGANSVFKPSAFNLQDLKYDMGDFDAAFNFGIKAIGDIESHELHLYEPSHIDNGVQMMKLKDFEVKEHIDLDSVPDIIGSVKLDLPDSSNYVKVPIKNAKNTLITIGDNGNSDTSHLYSDNNSKNNNDKIVKNINRLTKDECNAFINARDQGQSPDGTVMLSMDEYESIISKYSESYYHYTPGDTSKPYHFRETLSLYHKSLSNDYSVPPIDDDDGDTYGTVNYGYDDSN